jgi:RND family efflux transporter MFP subunit
MLHVFLFFSYIFVCYTFLNSENFTAVVEAAQPQTRPVLTPARKQPSSESALLFEASLMVENDVDVKTQLTGIINKILVDRGRYVKRGTPLAELANRDLALEIKRNESATEEAAAEYRRAKSLYDQKLLSESEYDAKRLGYDKARAELEIAKVEFEKSIIRAPFNGVVVERYAKPGQRVVEDESTALFRITAMEPLLARIFIPEEKLISVRRGMRAEFIPTLSPSQRFAARVKWISSTIDAASGTASALVEIVGTSSPNILKPGISGKIVLPLSEFSQSKIP